jgi:hypothetical protein
METKDYLKDIRDIKNMMSQSSQFISLSGLSGIMAGIYALIGGYIAGRKLPESEAASYKLTNSSGSTVEEVTNTLMLIAATVVIFSILTAIAFSSAKAKKDGQKLWNPSSRRLLINFCIPLVSGGIFALLLLGNGYYGLIAPVTLLFYGMACVNASKYTLRDIRYMGITLIILGLCSTYLIGFGLFFWMVGFGLCNILYGAIMYFKYDRK